MSAVSSNNPPGSAIQLPGAFWIDILRRPTGGEFATAFRDDATLEASVLPRTLRGVRNIRLFFEATKQMYDSVAFTAEDTAGLTTYLQWSGSFKGALVSGMTVLERDTEGKISGVRLYHRPYDQVIAFASELASRIGAEITEV